MPANTITVPAIRGQMGTTKYFTANFPMRMAVRLFLYDPDIMAAMPVEFRNQRKLKKNRIPEIADYITQHDDYIFSSITVSVDTDNLNFLESDGYPDVGMLELPMDVEWIVNDGQHRVAGIAEALKVDASLGKDSISVVVLPDGGLERRQQIFSDLNRTVQKTSKSLDIQFDRRMPINQITQVCVDHVPLFNGRTDRERVSLSLRSASFVTLSGLQAANLQLLGELPEGISDEEFARKSNAAVRYWNIVTGLVTPWRDIADDIVRPADARIEYISSYALTLWALGSLGSTVLDQSDDWKSSLANLGSVDWRKTNNELQGLCMLGGGIRFDA